MRQFMPLTFKLKGKAKNNILKVKKTDPQSLSEELLLRQTPSEWDRRTRALDADNLGHWKASGNFRRMKNQIQFIFLSIYFIFIFIFIQFISNIICFAEQFVHFPEWRALIVAFGPLLLEAVPGGPLKKFWRHLLIIARLLILPKQEFLRSGIDLREVCEKWYKLAETCFGPTVLKYNAHVLTHAVRMRISNHSACRTSAFTFENSYRFVLDSLRPGTTSTVKQAMQGAICLKTLQLLFTLIRFNCHF